MKAKYAPTEPGLQKLPPEIKAMHIAVLFNSFPNPVKVLYNKTRKKKI
ncbi:hypothetical protein LPC_0252 [Legionella pneumophila str. Corby]|nr:hypothetical protein LPC_0252 [Legionella pneumophila str. Corby]